jgi:hypothetical protein
MSHDHRVSLSAIIDTKFRLGRSSRTILVIAVIVTAFRLGPVCTALADNYSDLAAQGYCVALRWLLSRRDRLIVARHEVPG